MWLLAYYGKLEVGTQRLANLAPRRSVRDAPTGGWLPLLLGKGVRTEIWKIYKAPAVDGGVTGAVAVAAAAAVVRLEAAHAHTSRDMREFSQAHQALCVGTLTGTIRAARCTVVA